MGSSETTQNAWPIVPLGKLADDERNSITDGPFGSKLKTEHYTSAGPRVIRLTNIGDAEFIDAKAYISDAHFLTLQKHRVYPGDIVIAALGENPPRSCLIPQALGPAVVKADCIRFKAGPRVLPQFLNYALNGPILRRQAKGIIHGVGRPRLNLGEIKALPIPVPPLDEQRRIVAEIEQQFTRLEAGVTALRQVQAKLKRYRAAVLKAACEGRLVPTEAELARQQGRPYEPASELLARILTERRQQWDQRGKYKEPNSGKTDNLIAVPEGWTRAIVEQLSLKVVDGTHHTPEYVADGVAFISVKDIRDGKVYFDNCKFIRPEAHADLIKRCDAKQGDVLITKSGTIGRIAIVSTDRPFSLFVSVALIKSVQNVLNTKFLGIALQSYIASINIAQDVKGGMIKNLHLEDLRIVQIPLPPLAEQTRIVAEVEQRLSVVDALEAVVAANLKRAARLRQSILKRAFSGNFIVSKLEKIKHGNY